MSRKLVLLVALSLPQPSQGQPNQLVNVIRTEGSCKALAFSQNGEYFVLSGNFKDHSEIRYYALRTGKIVETFRGNDSPFHSVALNGKERLLAYGIWAADKDLLGVRVWNLSTNRKQYDFKTKSFTSFLAFTHDSRILASIDTKGTLIFWDLRKGRVLKNVQEHSEGACLAFSPDDKSFVSGGLDGKLIFWDGIKLKKERVLVSDARASFRVVAFSKDGNTLYAGDTNRGILLVFDLVKMKLEKSIAVSPLAVMTVSPSGRYLASGDQINNSIIVREISSGKRVAALPHSKNFKLEFIEFAADESTLASGANYSIKEFLAEVKFWSLK